MDGGRIAAEGSPRELITSYSTRDVVELRFEHDDVRRRALERLHDIQARVEPLADRVLVYSDDGEATVERLTSEGIHPDTMLVRRSTLEDVFLVVTGRQLIEEA